METLTALTAGMPIVHGGDRVTRVSAELAARFRPGDRLLVVDTSGELLHVPADVHAFAVRAVDRAAGAFAALAEVREQQLTAFFDAFAARLEAPGVWAAIAQANQSDVAAARARGRSTTRLCASDAMRADMIAGLRVWRDAAPLRGRTLERVARPGVEIELSTAPLGVIGFVFEGRPNVFADATGVLRSGNTAVFRIGSDALGTARAIVSEALAPALHSAGLPEGAAVLLDRPERAAGWALFADARLALAVARGSGGAVTTLGAVARQTGTPVSLHGTGGAWLVAGRSADRQRLAAATFHSLDRKVCNTLNVCAIVRERAAELVPVVLDALVRAGERRGFGFRLHVSAGSEGLVPAEWLARRVRVRRAEGDADEPLADVIPVAELGREWEWEETPEMALDVVDSVEQAVERFNRSSPRFVASLVAEDAEEQRHFFAAIDAPFVGDGFTRWVDGQWALGRPELGLSNWQHGRLLARGAVLSGDGLFTVRARAHQTDPDLHR